MTSLRSRLAAVGERINQPGQGLTDTGLKVAWGAVRTVRDTAKHRRLVSLRWSPRRHEWVHRFPDGRVADARWWRTSLAWATQGNPYDIDDLLWRHYRPKPGDMVVDVGAGHGAETYYLASMVGPTGRVLSVEAAPAPFARLRRLVELNDFANVTLEQAAVLDEPGTVSISDDDDWMSGNVYEARRTAEVEAVTMDELCRRHGIERIDWLKMNIEGAEKVALRGMVGIADRVRHLTISCHDFLGTDWGRSKVEVIRWLKDHGFTVEEHEDDPLRTFASDYVYAWRPGGEPR